MYFPAPSTSSNAFLGVGIVNKTQGEPRPTNWCQYIHLNTPLCHCCAPGTCSNSPDITETFFPQHYQEEAHLTLLSVQRHQTSKLSSVPALRVTAPVYPQEFRLIISYQPPSGFTPEQTLLIPFQIGLKRLISSIRTDKLSGEMARERHTCTFSMLVQSLYCMDPGMSLLVQYSHHFGKFFENNFPESR